jgi:hypothetical protein
MYAVSEFIRGALTERLSLGLTPKTKRTPGSAQAGSIFTVLLAGIAIAAALGVVLYQTTSASAEDAPAPPVMLVKNFVCDPPAWSDGKPRPIPPEKQLNDLCPAGARAWFFYDLVPQVKNIPPPLGPDTADPQKPQPDTGSKGP